MRIDIETSFLGSWVRIDLTTQEAENLAVLFDTLPGLLAEYRTSDDAARQAAQNMANTAEMLRGAVRAITAT